MFELSDSVVRLVHNLAALPGVVGVVLGGSRALGRHRPDSDVDLGVYYDAGRFDWPTMVRALEGADDRKMPQGLGAPGDWGPWMNGGAWLRIDGRAVDVLLRDAAFVEGILDQVREGRFSINYQIGHPLGFQSYMIAGEMHLNRPIAGDESRVRALKAKTSPYPTALRDAIASRFLFEGKLSAHLLSKLESRDDATHCAGLSYRAVMCLVQVVFALNETYLINEKGAVDATRDLAHVPPDFAARAHAVSAPSDEPRASRNLRLGTLVDEVEGIVRRLNVPMAWGPTSFPT